jgi:hypothetical protein
VAAGVHTIYLKALLNHSAGKGDTTVDYTVQNTNDLRLPAQRIVDQLKVWCGISEK